MARTKSSSLAKESEEELIAMWPGRSSRKDVGRKRDYSTLVGGISVNVKLARWRKEQKSTGSAGALQEVGAKSENFKEGVEVAKRYCCKLWNRV